MHPTWWGWRCAGRRPGYEGVATAPVERHSSRLSRPRFALVRVPRHRGFDRSRGKAVFVPRRQSEWAPGRTAAVEPQRTYGSRQLIHRWRIIDLGQCARPCAKLPSFEMWSMYPRAVVSRGCPTVASNWGAHQWIPNTKNQPRRRTDALKRGGTLTRREFVAVAAAVGATTVLPGALSARRTARKLSPFCTLTICTRPSSG
jgi:hypothetical protein